MRDVVLVAGTRSHKESQRRRPGPPPPWRKVLRLSKSTAPPPGRGGGPSQDPKTLEVPPLPAGALGRPLGGRRLAMSIVDQIS